ncbi:MAG TPA: extracellular solute-binding protein [Spirochaetia bacterium]|nr:extracellular solute-binding protein [Spirochaetia bacterium]
MRLNVVRNRLLPLWGILFSGFSLFFLAGTAAMTASAENLRMLYMAQAGYQPQSIQERAKEFTHDTGVPVDLTFAEYEDQYNLIAEAAAGKIPPFDVILVDLIWTADFARHHIIDPVPQPLVDRVKSGIIPEIYSAFEYRDRMWAYPFLANFQLFYSNSDLLHKAGFDRPPSTLEELVHMAELAKARGVADYPIFESWRKQEVLICDFVWLVGAFGGSLDAPHGRINVESTAARRALDFMVMLLKKGLVNPYSLQSDELFSADAFLWGDALFTTNWTFILGRMNEVPFNSTHFEASLIPVAEAEKKTASSTSTVSGFQGLSVMSNSRHKDLAWRFASYLSSPEFSRRHLEEMSVWKQVWNEAWTSERDPYLSIKRAELKGVHNRPAEPDYRSISAALQDWIYQALTGKVTSAVALAGAQREIDRVAAMPSE